MNHYCFFFYFPLLHLTKATFSNRKIQYILWNTIFHFIACIYADLLLKNTSYYQCWKQLLLFFVEIMTLSFRILWFNRKFKITFIWNVIIIFLSWHLKIFLNYWIKLTSSRQQYSLSLFLLFFSIRLDSFHSTLTQSDIRKPLNWVRIM